MHAPTSITAQNNECLTIFVKIHKVDSLLLHFLNKLALDVAQFQEIED